MVFIRNIRPELIFESPIKMPRVNTILQSYYFLLITYKRLFHYRSRRQFYRQEATAKFVNMNKLLFVVFVAVTMFATANCYDFPKPNCTRPNEEYQCGSACQTTCENVGKPCPVMNIRCNDRCYCVEGYARNGDYNAECIPISKCPNKNHSSESNSESSESSDYSDSWDPLKSH